MISDDPPPEKNGGEKKQNHSTTNESQAEISNFEAILRRFEQPDHQTQINSPTGGSRSPARVEVPAIAPKVSAFESVINQARLSSSSGNDRRVATANKRQSISADNEETEGNTTAAVNVETSQPPSPKHDGDRRDSEFGMSDITGQVDVEAHTARPDAGDPLKSGVFENGGVVKRMLTEVDEEKNLIKNELIDGPNKWNGLKTEVRSCVAEINDLANESVPPPTQIPTEIQTTPPRQNHHSAATTTSPFRRPATPPILTTLSFQQHSLSVSTPEQQHSITTTSTTTTTFVTVKVKHSLTTIAASDSVEDHMQSNNNNFAHNSKVNRPVPPPVNIEEGDPVFLPTLNDPYSPSGQPANVLPHMSAKYGPLSTPNISSSASTTFSTTSSTTTTSKPIHDNNLKSSAVVYHPHPVGLMLVPPPPPRPLSVKKATPVQHLSSSHNDENFNSYDRVRTERHTGNNVNNMNSDTTRRRYASAVEQKSSSVTSPSNSTIHSSSICSTAFSSSSSGCSSTTTTKKTGTLQKRSVASESKIVMDGNTHGRPSEMVTSVVQQQQPSTPGITTAMEALRTDDQDYNDFTGFETMTDNDLLFDTGNNALKVGNSSFSARRVSDDVRDVIRRFSGSGSGTNDVLDVIRSFAGSGSTSDNLAPATTNTGMEFMAVSCSKNDLTPTHQDHDEVHVTKYSTRTSRSVFKQHEGVSEQLAENRLNCDVGHDMRERNAHNQVNVPVVCEVQYTGRRTTPQEEASNVSVEVLPISLVAKNGKDASPHSPLHMNDVNDVEPTATTGEIQPEQASQSDQVHVTMEGETSKEDDFSTRLRRRPSWTTVKKSIGPNSSFEYNIDPIPLMAERDVPPVYAEVNVVGQGRRAMAVSSMTVGDMTVLSPSASTKNQQPEKPRGMAGLRRSRIARASPQRSRESSAGGRSPTRRGGAGSVTSGPNTNSHSVLSGLNDRPEWQRVTEADRQCVRDTGRPVGRMAVPTRGTQGHTGRLHVEGALHHQYQHQQMNPNERNSSSTPRINNSRKRPESVRMLSSQHHMQQQHTDRLSGSSASGWFTQQPNQNQNQNQNQRGRGTGRLSMPGDTAADKSARLSAGLASGTLSPARRSIASPNGKNGGGAVSKLMGQQQRSNEEHLQQQLHRSAVKAAAAERERMMVSRRSLGTVADYASRQYHQGPARGASHETQQKVAASGDGGGGVNENTYSAVGAGGDNCTEERSTARGSTSSGKLSMSNARPRASIDVGVEDLKGSHRMGMGELPNRGNGRNGSRQRQTGIVGNGQAGGFGLVSESDNKTGGTNVKSSAPNVRTNNTKGSGHFSSRRGMNSNGRSNARSSGATPSTAPVGKASSSMAAAMSARASSVRRMLSFTPERRAAVYAEGEDDSSSSSRKHLGDGGKGGRSKVTVPKPFSLTGATLQQRTQTAMEEARRRTVEVESRRRVFRARPMPDFSKPYPLPKSSL